MRRAALALAAVLVSLSGLAGCSSGHSALGTASGTCYLALPTARATVHGNGELIGVRSFDVASLVRRLAHPTLGASPSAGSTSTSNPWVARQHYSTSNPWVPGQPLSGHYAYQLRQQLARAKMVRFLKRKLAVFGKQKVCLVAYHGSYPPGSVDNAVDPHTAGSYAMVVLPVKGGNPVVAFVLKRIPLRMRHLF
jgi:hypothetical protein